MFILIFSAVFCLFAGLYILYGAMNGRKYRWQKSLASIIVVIISAVLAALLSALLSNLVIRLVADLIISSGLLGDIGNIFLDLPTGVELASAVVSMTIAPVIFIPMFRILKAILNLFAKLIVRAILKATSGKTEEPEKKEEDAETTEAEAVGSAESAEAAEASENEKDAKKAKKKEKKVEFDEKGRKIVKRKVSEKNKVMAAEYFNPLGAVLGGLCSFLVFCVVLIPIVGAVDSASELAAVAVDAIPEEQTEIVAVADTVMTVVEGADKNAGAVIVKYTGGKALYGVMTATVINGEFANFNKETEFFSAVADAAGTTLSDECTPTEKGTAIRNISPAFDKSVIVRTLISEICTAAGEDWKAGKDFYGIARPSIGGDFEDIVSSMIDVFATADADNIKKDVHAITEAAAVLIESGAITDLQNDPMSILADEETTSALLGAFLDDDRLDPMVDGVADFGINILLDTILTPNTREELYEDFVNSFVAVEGNDAATLTKAYGDVFDDYGIRVFEDTLAYAVERKLAGSNMNDWLFTHVAKNPEEFANKTVLISADMITDGVTPITNREHEADALAHAFAVVYGMTADLKGDSFNTKNMIGQFGPALDSFTVTETIGAGKTGLVLTAVLQSKTVHDQLGMSVLEATDTANSIVENSGKKSYASVMQSLTGVIEVLEAAADKGVNTKEAVDKMLENLTPEAASVMQTMATPNVVKNYGVPEANAGPVANMISSTFGNLQDVPAEDYDKESAAVADMMNVMMSMSEGGSNGTFGGEESDTQLSADEYVTNIMDSTAMSKTVVDTVYGEDDEPTLDPMNSGRNLGEGEKAELLDSLNNKWAESDKDETTKRQIVSIAAMMNMSVVVDENGVTEAVIEDAVA